MSEMPEDIQRTAFSASGAFYHDFYLRRELAEAIADLLFAERDRCRQIAVEVAQDADGGEYYIAHVIAAAISKAPPHPYP